MFASWLSGILVGMATIQSEIENECMGVPWQELERFGEARDVVTSR